jgi:ubiquinone/menaquinone biosynthesis C-methylase UbiE
MTYTNPAAYDRFMGRWSAHLAPLFVRFSEVEDRQRIVDVGCGTGSLTRALLSEFKAIRIEGVDPIAAYVDFARQATDDARVEFRVGAAEALPFPDGTFDAALALLVLQDIGDPHCAIREMARVTRLGGRVAACQWDFANGLPMLSLFWGAAEVVAPREIARRRANASPSKPAGLDDLAEYWRRAGLRDVMTESLEIAMRFCDFHDFWQPFLAGSTPTSAFAATLNHETGGNLERALRDKIPDIQPDGSFVLPARAWAVLGVTGR